MAGAFGPNAAHATHSHEQQRQQHHEWVSEVGEWQRREADYKAQLERHYYAEQEAEYQAQVAEYYTARREHQEHQQRLNQVLYGHCAGYPQQHPQCNAPAALGSLASPFQPNRHTHQQAWQQGWQQGWQQQQQQADAMDCCSPAPGPHSPPRAPLAAVSCNFRPLPAASPAWRTNMAGSGGGWEGASLAASAGALRKRSRDVAALGEPCAGGCTSPGGSPAYVPGTDTASGLTTGSLWLFLINQALFPCLSVMVVFAIAGTAAKRRALLRRG